MTRRPRRPVRAPRTRQPRGRSRVGERFEAVAGPIAHGGHVVVRHAERVVFVRHALPGERVVVEVTEAVTRVWGSDKVGIRLSPLTTFSDIGDSNPEPLYLSLVEQLNAFKLAYIHVVEGDTGGTRHPAGGFDLQKLKKASNALYIANNGFTRDLALEARDNDEADLICFGRPFISNPDLVERLQQDAKLAEPDQATFYAGEAKGYTDYPTL